MSSSFVSPEMITRARRISTVCFYSHRLLRLVFGVLLCSLAGALLIPSCLFAYQYLSSFQPMYGKGGRNISTEDEQMNAMFDTFHHYIGFGDISDGDLKHTHRSWEGYTEEGAYAAGKTEQITVSNPPYRQVCIHLKPYIDPLVLAFFVPSLYILQLSETIYRESSRDEWLSLHSHLLVFTFAVVSSVMILVVGMRLPAKQRNCNQKSKTK